MARKIAKKVKYFMIASVLVSCALVLLIIGGCFSLSDNDNQGGYTLAANTSDTSNMPMAYNIPETVVSPVEFYNMTLESFINLSRRVSGFSWLLDVVVNEHFIFFSDESGIWRYDAINDTEELILQKEGIIHIVMSDGRLFYLLRGVAPTF